jgi:hypothetical protein
MIGFHEEARSEATDATAHAAAAQCAVRGSGISASEGEAASEASEEV